MSPATGCSADSSAPPNATHRDVVPGAGLVEMPMKLIGVLGNFSLRSNSNSRLGLVLQFWVHSPLCREVDLERVISCPEIWMSA